MTKNFVSIRVRHHKITGDRNATNAAKHDLRLKLPGYLMQEPEIFCIRWENWKEKPENDLDLASNFEAPSDDESRKKITEEIKAEFADRREDMSRRVKEFTKRRMQEKATPFTSGIITFSSEGIQNVDDTELFRVGAMAVRELCEKNDVKPIYISMHLDEKVRHFHFMMEAINSKGISVRRTKLFTREGCSKLQDWIGEKFGHLGLRRGESKSITGAVYKTVSQSHNEALIKLQKEQLEVQGKVSEAQNELLELREGVKVGKEVLGDLQDKQVALTGVLGALERERIEAQDKVLDVQNELSELQEEVKHKKEVLGDLQNKEAVLRGSVDELQRQLAELNDQIRKKRLTRAELNKKSYEEKTLYNKDVNEMRANKRRLKTEIQEAEKLLQSNEYVEVKAERDMMARFISEKGLDLEYSLWAEAYKLVRIQIDEQEQDEDELVGFSMEM